MDDRDQLEACRESLREHMEMAGELAEALEALLLQFGIVSAEESIADIEAQAEAQAEARSALRRYRGERP
jgi:hypothetical protein